MEPDPLPRETVDVRRMCARERLGIAADRLVRLVVRIEDQNVRRSPGSRLCRSGSEGGQREHGEQSLEHELVLRSLQPPGPGEEHRRAEGRAGAPRSSFTRGDAVR